MSKVTSKRKTTSKVKRVVRHKKPKYKHDRPEYLTKEYQMFVRQVRERDGNACVYPGCKKRKWGLECHHILPWSKFPMLRYNPTNAVMLCQFHHKKVTGVELIWAPMFMQIVQQNITKQQEKKTRGYYND